ncbi:MAG: murein biosynthesis integral membrane protein MurJ [Deltaproteobacteria bacterium]|nr:murein biosynthesis integral membrane protein MurJ [Deltaproteobacteria bacterium]
MTIGTSHEKRITGAASIVGAATVLSRVLGYMRDAAIAYVFGAGILADAFFMAFRIANLLRRLVGEGALTASFIPIFTEEMERRSREETRRFASSVFTLFAIILAALAALGAVFSKEIVWLMSPGFASDPMKFSITVSLTRLMFPYMFFIGLMAIAMGVLNSMRHFTAPALSPVFFNLAIIASVFAIAPFLNEPVYALAIGVLIGGALQFLLQVPYLKRYGMSPRPVFDFSDPGIKKVFLLMGPSVLGVGVYQLNIFVTLWFASRLEAGSVSYLYYAGRLMELPIGIFGVAVSTAVLPSLAEHVVRKEWGEFRNSLSFALRIVTLVTVPATVGLLVLSYPIIDVLFRRGEFGASAAAGTAAALYFYAVGLVPVAAARILAPVFYSLKDTRTPVWTAFISFLFNVIMCVLLAGPLKHGGLALATSLSAFVNMFLLFVILRVRFGRFGGRKILASAIKNAVSALVMGGIIYLLLHFSNIARMGTLPKTIFIAFSVVVGIAVYLLVSRLLRTEEIAFLKGFLKKSANSAS